MGIVELGTTKDAPINGVICLWTQRQAPQVNKQG